MVLTEYAISFFHRKAGLVSAGAVHFLREKEGGLDSTTSLGPSLLAHFDLHNTVLLRLDKAPQTLQIQSTDIAALSEGDRAPPR